MVSRILYVWKSAIVLLLVQVFASDVDYAKIMYDIAVKSSHINENINSVALSKVHLIRVPKASSSSLSTVARRIVGCTPPGPCCKWPGDPVGTCPSKDLFSCQLQEKVIGCTHHYPNYGYLKNSSVISISMIREPKSRSISAFFYPGIHHNSHCNKDQDYCFKEYANSPKWNNVVTKLLTGLYAYAPDKVCQYTRQCSHSLELALLNLNMLKFMGVAEMWELSLLLLHFKLPMLKPLLDEFKLQQVESKSKKNDDSKKVQSTTVSSSTTKTSTRLVSNNGVSNATSVWLGDTNTSSTISLNHHSRMLSFTRTNLNDNYHQFKSTAKNIYALELQHQNEYDIIIFRHVVKNMCNDLHSYGLWDSEQIIAQYWREQSPLMTDKCF